LLSVAAGSLSVAAGLQWIAKKRAVDQSLVDGSDSIHHLPSNPALPGKTLVGRSV
jgi:hypothetical protein